MVKIIIWLLSLLILIPRIAWIDVAYSTVSFNQEATNPESESLASTPKRKRKSNTDKLTIEKAARNLLIQAPTRKNNSYTPKFKNLMVYISPTKSFKNKLSYVKVNASEVCAKIQIENSIALGWKPEDIMLVTNFDFEYGPVKAIVLPEANAFEPFVTASKINGIVELFKNDLIKEDTLYWFHDLDGFQLSPIDKDDIDLTAHDMALPDHTPKLKRWSAFSIFFKKDTEDIFQKIKDKMYEKSTTEELALQEITDTDSAVAKRIKRLDKTYKYTPGNSSEEYKKATRPIRVVHFHPQEEIPSVDVNTNKPILTDNLLRLFKYHRVI